jgi:hypothetical protein
MLFTTMLSVFTAALFAPHLTPSLSTNSSFVNTAGETYTSLVELLLTQKQPGHTFGQAVPSASSGRVDLYAVATAVSCCVNVVLNVLSVLCLSILQNVRRPVKCAA